MRNALIWRVSSDPGVWSSKMVSPTVTVSPMNVLAKLAQASIVLARHVQAVRDIEHVVAAVGARGGGGHRVVAGEGPGDADAPALLDHQELARVAEPDRVLLVGQENALPKVRDLRWDLRRGRDDLVGDVDHAEAPAARSIACCFMRRQISASNLA